MGRWSDTPNGRFVLAEARIARGDWSGAAELLAAHLAIYPDDGDARQLLALVGRRGGPDPGQAPPESRLPARRPR